MAAERNETGEAEKEAALAGVFYEHLLHRGIEESAAREMSVAYILGRQRREKREEWEGRD